MIIIAVVGAVILAVVGGIFLAYLGRHPKCPYCGERVNFVIPIMLKRCKLSYTCNNCNREAPGCEVSSASRREIKMKQDPSKRRRSIAKALTWRFMSTLITGGLAFAFFGGWEACGILMACDFVIKFLLYYYYERSWHQVAWGKESIEE